MPQIVFHQQIHATLNLRVMAAPFHLMEHAHKTMRNARARHRGNRRHLALKIQVSGLGTGLKEMWCDNFTKVLGTHDTITTYKFGVIIRSIVGNCFLNFTLPGKQLSSKVITVLV